MCHDDKSENILKLEYASGGKGFDKLQNLYMAD